MRTFTERYQKWLSAAVVALLVVGGVFAASSVLGSGKHKHLTAYFPSAIGIYKGSSVRVLGVQVGTITRLKPEGTRVEVDISYDASVKLPAALSAEIIPPSIVSDRYLQLDPPYAGGPIAANGATIQEADTEVPVELDAIFGSLNDLDVALGPNGANKNGALSQLINVGAANLAGNGAEFNSTLHGFSEAVGALSDSRDALFGTIAQLQKFTTTLADDNGGVAAISNDLTGVAGQLAGERTDLGSALTNLAVALGDLQTFVSDNKSTLTSDLHSLTTVTSGLVSEQQAIKEIIDEAPLGLQNLDLAYNRDQASCSPEGTGCAQGLLQTRTNIDPVTLGCQLLAQTLSDEGLGSALTTDCAKLAATGSGVTVPTLPTLPLPTPSLPVPLPTISLPVPLPTISLPVPLPTISLPVPLPTISLPPLDQRGAALKGDSTNSTNRVGDSAANTGSTATADNTQTSPTTAGAASNTVSSRSVAALLMAGAT